MGFRTAGTERMRLDSSGRLGIGTTSPTEKLSVIGNLLLNNASGDVGIKLGPTGVEAYIGYAGSSGNLQITPRSGYNTTISSGNVGIGTSSPASKLQVAGGSILLDNNTALNWKDSVGTARTGILWGTSNQLAFYSGTDNAEKMRIDSSGNTIAKPSGGEITLGANGHITSKQSLDVATAGGRYIGASNRGTVGQIRIEQTTTSADGGYVSFDTCASGSTSPTERMRIDSSGRVGIGTTATTNARLTVQADGNNVSTFFTNPDGTYNPYLQTFHEGVNGVRVLNSSSFGGTAGNYTQDVAANYIVKTGNTERMRIDSSGNVGINNSSPNGPLSIQPNSDSLLTSHGGGRYREFLKAGGSLDTTLRVDLSFTSQGSEWDQHIVELYICGGDAIASTQRVASLKYAVSTLTTMSTPTVLSQDLQGLTLTSSVASGLTLQVTVTSTADIDKFVVVAKVYSQESNGRATSLNVV